MRCIDADALLERVWSEKIQAQAHGREFSTCFMSPGGTPSTEWWYVEDLIENAPTIEPEPKWIPCSETVDIPDHEIMACDKYGELMFGYLAYEDEQWICASDGCEMVDTIAWREKPEPYREEGDPE